MKPLALIVEDWPEFRSIVEEILAGEGYEVIAAEDPEGAMVLWRKNRGRITLVILDYDLGGGKNTRGLAEEIRENKFSGTVIYASSISEINEGMLEAELCTIALSRKTPGDLKEAILSVAALP